MMAQKQPEAVDVTVQVGFPALHSRLTIALTPARLMRSRRGERVGDNEASYARWAVQGAHVDGRGERSIYGITEMIQLRPVTYGEPL